MAGLTQASQVLDDHQKMFYSKLNTNFRWRGKGNKIGAFCRSLIEDSTFNDFKKCLKYGGGEGSGDGSMNKKTPLDYYLTARYTMENDSILNRKTKSRIIPVSQIYEEIRVSHVATGHGGEKRTHHDLKSRGIANIPLKLVSMFVSTCVVCLKKRVSHGSKNRPITHILSSQFGDRGQVDLIDMSSCNSTNYRYILNYQDHLTKFCILRPMETKDALSTTILLIDIFSLIGCPKILQCDNGLEFRLHSQIYDIWPDLQIVHGRPRHPQSQGSVERANQDVQQMLRCYMEDNQTTDWVKGLPIIQLQKNNSLNRTISCSPFLAVFGNNLALKPAYPQDGNVSDVELDISDTGALDFTSDINGMEAPSTSRDADETLERVQYSPTREEDLSTGIFITEDGHCSRMVGHAVRDNNGALDEETNGGGGNADMVQRIQKIDAIRKSAGKSMRGEANKNIMKNKNYIDDLGGENAIGKIVTVNIPKFDKVHKFEQRNILCQIYKYFPNMNKYKVMGLQSKEIVKNYFSAYELSVCKNYDPVVSITKLDMHKELPLRSVVYKEQTLFGGCDCKSACENDKCRCRKKMIKCKKGICHSNSFKNCNNMSDGNLTS